jgi:5-methyltetrahydrofolate--homocysteine methyltransferase
MNDGKERLILLQQRLGEHILVIDGALGTSLQEMRLDARDYGGAAMDGCNEHLVLTRPELLRQLHADFLAAGADLIETNSFGATRVVLAEFGLAHQAREINRRAAALARQIAADFSTAAWPRFVIGAMGPTTKSISLTAGVSFDQLCAAYQEQAEGLLEGGADVLLLETVQDTLNAKAGLAGIRQAQLSLGTQAGVAVQGTIETMGTLLAGQDIEAFYVSLAHYPLLWIGLNCATGPDFMTDHLRTLAAVSRFPVACVPNAGLPDEEGRYHETPALLAGKLEAFMAQGWLNLVGGCCGTRPAHIRALAQAARRHRPRRPDAPRRTVVSGNEVLVIGPETRPVIVGERTNVLGSRRFKRQIAQGPLTEAAEVGRAQIKRGAHMLDVCLQDPDRDEIGDLAAFLSVLAKRAGVPIMIDSTDHRAVEAALRRLAGKAIINSVNLEEGEDAQRLTRVAELARSYGAALVVGCIDDDPHQAQAISRERKLEIALRSHDLLTRRFGIPAEDLIFDPLIFPAGTGDLDYRTAAAETLAGIRAIKTALPQCKTLLGISNVSFGLPEAAREVLNSVMLYHCARAGLDMAIINPEKLRPYVALAPEERRLAEDLIWWRGTDPIGAFAACFAGRRAAPPATAREALPLDERLARHIVEGAREDLRRDLDLALQSHRPLAIINGPLMRGMEEVGRLFNANQMIVAEVLESAEAMKAAVSYLQPHLERDESITRGTIMLATVKGDVHDIGKNLVDIILGNNGYRVINLGIKVPPEELIRAYHEHRPDLIGLSGLLVKSAQMMAATAQDLAAAGIDCPLLVGGAALSERFARTRIAPLYPGPLAYARDAMAGLELANRLMDPKLRPALENRLAADTARLLAAAPLPAPRQAEPAPAQRPLIEHGPIPTPPDLQRHVWHDYDLAAIFSYVNPVMLYTRHLGLRDAERELASGNPKALELRAVVEEVQALMIGRDDIGAHAVYRFFPACSEDGRLTLMEPDGGAAAAHFTFGRQSAPPHLCLADFVAPLSPHRHDYVCLFATTIGPGVRALAEQWKREGEYLRSHILQVLALEGAEAFAELLHRELRRLWGIGDPPQLTIKDLFQAHYRGRRFSFGYPACPRLEDQAILFRLLEPEVIGVRLTEGFMMEPEGSVSALVVHHPQARYFALSPADSERLMQGDDSFAPAVAGAR